MFTSFLIGQPENSFTWNFLGRMRVIISILITSLWLDLRVFHTVQGGSKWYVRCSLFFCCCDLLVALVRLGPYFFVHFFSPTFTDLTRLFHQNVPEELGVCVPSHLIDTRIESVRRKQKFKVMVDSPSQVRWWVEVWVSTQEKIRKKMSNLTFFMFCTKNRCFATTSILWHASLCVMAGSTVVVRTEAFECGRYGYLSCSQLRHFPCVTSDPFCFILSTTAVSVCHLLCLVFDFRFFLNQNGKCVDEFLGHEDDITCLTVREDVLFSGSWKDDKTIRWWDCRVSDKSLLFLVPLVVVSFKTLIFFVTFSLLLLRSVLLPVLFSPLLLRSSRRENASKF